MLIITYIILHYRHNTQSIFRYEHTTLLFFGASSLGEICPLRKSACSHRESAARRIGMGREGRRAGSRAGVGCSPAFSSESRYSWPCLNNICYCLVSCRRQLSRQIKPFYCTGNSHPSLAEPDSLRVSHLLLSPPLSCLLSRLLM